MLVSIDTYSICNGTLAGGVSVSTLHFKIDRTIDVVIPIGQVNPATFDRVCRRLDMTFQVKRTHASIDAAELFILDLDDNLPSAGIVKVTLAGGVRYIPNGKVPTHELVQQLGATTFHNYTIVGGKPILLPPTLI
jgi:hypothetical protein